MIEVVDQKLQGIKLIQLKVFSDERGFFSENYRKPLYEKMGINTLFVQDNHSFSKKNTIRGMHFQKTPGQAKLISVLVGTIYDVFVDIRPESSTFGKWGAYELDASKKEQLFIPVGFAHGFGVLSEEAHVYYKVSTVFQPETEETLFYNDSTVGIEWPIQHPILSERDKNALSFQELFG